MEMDWSFTGEEDFGLAKSFSNAPMTMIAPKISHDFSGDMSND